MNYLEFPSLTTNPKLQIKLNWTIHETSVRFELVGKSFIFNRVEYQSLSGWLYKRNDGTWGLKQKEREHEPDPSYRYYNGSMEIYCEYKTRFYKGSYREPNFDQKDRLFKIVIEEWQALIKQHPELLIEAKKRDKEQEIKSKLRDIKDKEKELEKVHSELYSLNQELAALASENA